MAPVNKVARLVERGEAGVGGGLMMVAPSRREESFRGSGMGESGEKEKKMNGAPKGR
jgi:hypothetical protein